MRLLPGDLIIVSRFSRLIRNEYNVADDIVSAFPTVALVIEDSVWERRDNDDWCGNRKTWITVIMDGFVGIINVSATTIVSHL